MSDSDAPLLALRDQAVVAEISQDFTVFGTLIDWTESFLVIANADLHSQTEANSSRDIYALEARDIGIRPNRKQLLVPRANLLAIARLDDVLP